MAILTYEETPVIPLEKAFPDFLTGGGIFEAFTDFEWIPDNDSAFSLDVDYFLNRSGRKVAAPLVCRYVDAETQALDSSAIGVIASVIQIRFGGKWNKLWEQYASTVSILSNTDITHTVEYDTAEGGTTTDALNKEGTETQTIKGTETKTETFSDPLQNPFKTTRQISGSYKDTDSTVSTRTGSQLVTDKGNLLNNVYGFNSSSAVPQSSSGPETAAGTTQETTYGANGLIDTNSGGVERTYTNYKDEVTQSGSKTTTDSYGQDGKTIETSFDDRSDTHTITHGKTHTGTDTTTEAGYRNLSLKDKLEFIKTLYTDPTINNFFEVVFSDMDSVLTCPIFV